MTKDDIIRMAQEAGLPAFLYPELIAETDWVLIERFAALVAAHEREEFAIHAVDIARRAIAEEREACAKVCDELVIEVVGNSALAVDQCSRTIRARGQA